MTLPAAATSAPSGPWWIGPISALAGIVVGFALKAWFDWFLERRREDREDKHRFANDKMKAYADFVSYCHETVRLLERMDSWSCEVADLDDSIADALARHGDQPIDDVPELADLRAQALHMRERRAELDKDIEACIKETGRLNGLIALIAPMHVVEVAHETNALLAADDFNEAAFDDAFARFVALAGLDLGRQVQLQG